MRYEEEWFKTLIKERWEKPRWYLGNAYGILVRETWKKLSFSKENRNPKDIMEMIILENAFFLFPEIYEDIRKALERKNSFKHFGEKDEWCPDFKINNNLYEITSAKPKFYKAINNKTLSADEKIKEYHKLISEESNKNFKSVNFNNPNNICFGKEGGIPVDWEADQKLFINNAFDQAKEKTDKKYNHKKNINIIVWFDPYTYSSIHLIDLGLKLWLKDSKKLEFAKSVLNNCKAIYLVSARRLKLGNKEEIKSTIGIKLNKHNIESILGNKKVIELNNVHEINYEN